MPSSARDRASINTRQGARWLWSRRSPARGRSRRPHRLTPNDIPDRTTTAPDSARAARVLRPFVWAIPVDPAQLTVKDSNRPSIRAGRTTRRRACRPMPETRRCRRCDAPHGQSRSQYAAQPNPSARPRPGHRHRRRRGHLQHHPHPGLPETALPPNPRRVQVDQVGSRPQRLLDDRAADHATTRPLSMNRGTDIPVSHDETSTTAMPRHGAGRAGP
jgi:hypothetical protein